MNSTPLPPANSKRELDLRYLDRSYEENVKPYFHFVLEHLSAFITGRDGVTLLEVGCATGAFVQYTLTQFPALRCTGVDVWEELVARAQLNVPNATFMTSDIERSDTLPRERFDAVVMLTLHSHFDSNESWMANIGRLMKPDGRAFVFGLFNPFPVDVVLRARECSRSAPGAAARRDSQNWLTGWNLHSQVSVAACGARLGLESSFSPYQVPHAIQPSDDPLRARTSVLADGSYLLYNGMQVIHSFSLLQLRWKTETRDHNS